MQMWMVWLLWGAFIAIVFGLLTDVVSGCKGYAKSWFFPGLFLGPIALVILLLKEDPEGQVRYIDYRKSVEEQQRNVMQQSAAQQPDAMQSNAAQQADPVKQEKKIKDLSSEEHTGELKTPGYEADSDPKVEEQDVIPASMGGAAGDQKPEKLEAKEGMWICPVCGADNQDEFSWCLTCGNARQ